jgi:hypothetical protein
MEQLGAMLVLVIYQGLFFTSNPSFLFARTALQIFLRTYERRETLQANHGALKSFKFRRGRFLSVFS